MKRLWYLLLAISLGANAGFAVVFLARSKSRPPERREPPRIQRVLDEHLDRMTEGLGLSEEQRGRLAKAYEVSFPRILEQNRAVMALRRQVHDDFGAQAVDAEALRALVQRLSREQARLDSLVTETMLEEAAVLTTEQRLRYLPLMPWTRTGGAPPDRGPGARGERPPGREPGGPPPQGP